MTAKYVINAETVSSLFYKLEDVSAEQVKTYLVPDLKLASKGDMSVSGSYLVMLESVEQIQTLFNAENIVVYQLALMAIKKWTLSGVPFKLLKDDFLYPSYDAYGTVSEAAHVISQSPSQNSRLKKMHINNNDEYLASGGSSSPFNKLEETSNDNDVTNCFETADVVGKSDEPLSTDMTVDCDPLTADDHAILQRLLDACVDVNVSEIPAIQPTAQPTVQPTTPSFTSDQLWDALFLPQQADDHNSSRSSSTSLHQHSNVSHKRKRDVEFSPPDKQADSRVEKRSSHSADYDDDSSSLCSMEEDSDDLEEGDDQNDTKSHVIFDSEAPTLTLQPCCAEISYLSHKLHESVLKIGTNLGSRGYFADQMRARGPLPLGTVNDHDIMNALVTEIIHAQSGHERQLHVALCMLNKALSSLLVVHETVAESVVDFSNTVFLNSVMELLQTTSDEYVLEEVIILLEHVLKLQPGLSGDLLITREALRHVTEAVEDVRSMRLLSVSASTLYSLFQICPTDDAVTTMTPDIFTDIITVAHTILESRRGTKAQRDCATEHICLLINAVIHQLGIEGSYCTLLLEGDLCGGIVELLRTEIDISSPSAVALCSAIIYTMYCIIFSSETVQEIECVLQTMPLDQLIRIMTESQTFLQSNIFIASNSRDADRVEQLTHEVNCLTITVGKCLKFMSDWLETSPAAVELFCDPLLPRDLCSYLLHCPCVDTRKHLSLTILNILTHGCPTEESTVVWVKAGAVTALCQSLVLYVNQQRCYENTVVTTGDTEVQAESNRNNTQLLVEVVSHVVTLLYRLLVRAGDGTADLSANIGDQVVSGVRSCLGAQEALVAIGKGFKGADDYVDGDGDENGEDTGTKARQIVEILLSRR